MILFKRVAAITLTLCVLSLPAHAVDGSDAAMRKDGYGDVADLIKSMTPEQRAEVMKQAAARQKELAAMTPQQRAALSARLHSIHDTLKVDEVDPEKLDVSKAKSTQDTLKDFQQYQQKYAAGKIDNAVVIPKGDSQ